MCVNLHADGSVIEGYLACVTTCTGEHPQQASKVIPSHANMFEISRPKPQNPPMVPNPFGATPEFLANRESSICFNPACHMLS